MFQIYLKSLVTGEHACKLQADSARFHCFVLGIAQDGGVPHMGCNKPCCTAARKNSNVLFPASLGIHDTQTDNLLLIEATPAIDSQVAMLQEFAGISESRPVFDALMLTHAHMGHYAGLLQLGKEVAATETIPTYVTKRMAEFLTANAPWSQLIQDKNIELREVDEATSFSPIDGLHVQAIPVPHRDDWSDTVAFKISGSSQTVLFVPDIDQWDGNEQLLEQLLDGVDVAYIDATFYDGKELPGRDLSIIPHPFMVDTMELLQEYATAHPSAIRFIHLNHSNPALSECDIQKDIRNRGFQIATQGEIVTL